MDDKSPSEVPADYLVTSAQKDLFTRMTSTSVNYNIFKLFAQYWTETQYTDEVNYDIRGRDIGGGLFTYLYRDVLNDLEDAKSIVSENEFLSEEEKAAQTGVIEIMEIYTWSVLVDTFGDVPYSEALMGVDNLTPVYDNDEDIYADLFDRMDAALAQLDGASNSFGSADLIYDGFTSQWMKFGNSLKLRMAVRIADYDSAKAATLAKEAVAGGVFTSEDDNFAFPFETTTPNTNPIWVSLVQSGRDDFLVADTFVDLIVPLDDPRAPVFLADNKDTYVGAPYGAGAAFTDYTHIGDAFYQPDLEAVLLSYDEVEFLQAEAIERGLIDGDAASHYNAAVTASILYWGGTQAEADAYLAQPAVAYDTAGDSWEEVIGNQKYIALYGRGFEAWSSWRLLDYPNTFTRPAVSGEAVPRRYLYGNDDKDLNPDNYAAASSAMGGDKKDSRVFWDIEGQGN
ncbi:MAG: SusD/RagB family nutrient-binding outer membrane lipoprotein [Christiangramia sp.]